MGSIRGVLEATSDRRNTGSSYVSAGIALSCLVFVVAAVLMSGCVKQNPDSDGAKLSESAGMSESAGEPTDSAKGPVGPADDRPPPAGGRPPAAKGSPIKIPFFQQRGMEFDMDLKMSIESAFAQACKDAGNSPGCVTLSYVITYPGDGDCRFAGFDPDRPTKGDVVTVDAETAVVVKLGGSEPCPVSYEGNSTTNKTTTGSATVGNGTTGSTTTSSATTGNEVWPTEPAAPPGG